MAPRSHALGPVWMVFLTASTLAMDANRMPLPVVAPLLLNFLEATRTNRFCPWAWRNQRWHERFHPHFNYVIPVRCYVVSKLVSLLLFMPSFGSIMPLTQSIVAVVTDFAINRPKFRKSLMRSSEVYVGWVPLSLQGLWLPLGAMLCVDHGWALKTA